MPEPQPRRPPASSPAARAVAAAFRGTATNGRASQAVPGRLLESRRKRAHKRLQEALEARGTEPVPPPLRARIEALVAAWAEKDFSDTFEDVEQFEMDCFAEGEFARAEQSGDADQVFAALEERHRADVVKEHGKLEIRGLQMSARVYQDLDVAYVPLRIEDGSLKGKAIRAHDGIEIITVPRLSVPELLAKHERAVLVGAPGSGKTTIVSYLATMAAAGRLHGETGWKESPVPFVVPVRSLRGERLDAEAIAAVSCGAGADFVRWVLGERRGLVLVDGLDEALGGAGAIIPALKAFTKAYPGNRILVTTRPAGPVGSERLEVPGFTGTTLLPMTRDEVYVFIERWCLAAEVSIQKDRARAEDEATRAADDLKARVKTSRPVERLAQTPLMCSVLCIVHRFLGQRIPERRAALYDACTNVLLYEWDRAKFPEGSVVGQLDAQDKRFLLAGIARRMHDAHVAEISWANLMDALAERLPLLKRSANDADKVIREIQLRSGLLVERRPGMFAFSHLTFQEYLVAVEIVRAREMTKLLEVYEDRWWHEVIALAAGQPTADANAFVRALLDLEREGQPVSVATLLAAQCSETAISLLNSVRHDVDARLARIVPPRSNEEANRLIGLGHIVGPALLGALRTADAEGRARICVVLGKIDYELATNALMRLLADGDFPALKNPGVWIPVHVGRWGGNFVILSGEPMSVGFFAAIALFNMALSSAHVRAVLEASIGDAHKSVHAGLRYWHDRQSFWGNSAIVELLRSLIERIKASRPGKPAPRRAARSG
jgi:energy-coupling factor transporter ATP-binding protein EcfA2